MGQGWLLGPYRALNHRFVVDGVDAEPVRVRLEHALAPLQDETDPAARLTRYRVRRVGREDLPRFKVSCGTRTIATDQTPYHAAGLVLWHVNQSVVRADRGQHLLLHGAAAELDGVLVVLLAASGTGKTTTAAGLLNAGYRYLTDEVVALDRSSLGSTPFPKALALNADVVDHFALTGPVAGVGARDAVRHLTWSQLGSPAVTSGLRPGLVVALRRRDGGPRPPQPGIGRHLSPAETAMVLTAGTFEFERRPQRNMRAIARFVDSVPGVELEVSGVVDSVDQIASWVGAIVNGSAPSLDPWPRKTSSKEAHMEAIPLVATDAKYTPVPDLTVLEVGDEAVVMHPRSGVVTRLDASSRVVWSLLDGDAPLDQTVDELSDAYGISRDVMRADVTALVAELVRLDLVRDRRKEPVGAQDAGSNDQTRASTNGGKVASLDERASAEGDGSSPTVLRVSQSACYKASTKLGWTGTQAWNLGDVVIGVRYDSEQVAHALREAARPWIVAGFDVDANLSIRAPRRRDDGRDELAIVYRGCAIVGRHRSFDAALQQVLREAVVMAAQASPTVPDAWISAGAIVPADGSDRVVLAPPELGAMLSVGAGRPRLLSTAVVLDPSSGDVLTPVALSADGRSVEVSQTQGWRRLRVVGWIMDPRPGEAPADGLVAAMSNVHLGAQEPAAVWRGVSSLLGGGVEWAGVPASSGQLNALLERWFG